MMTDHVTNNFKLKTPYYVFDIRALRERTALLKEKAHQKGVSLCYAVKANPFLTPYLADLVESFEVCSYGELKICKAQELDAGKIVLSGVNKEEEFIRDGISSDVKYLTAESLSHFQCIEKTARAMRKQVKVLLRLSCGAQFGMDRSVLEDIIRERESYEYVRIAGIHFFSGTQKRKLQKITGELD
ncbi:MAG: alanine racemase, partial [Lachnospiraceae bacterium]